MKPIDTMWKPVLLLLLVALTAGAVVQAAEGPGDEKGQPEKPVVKIDRGFLGVELTTLTPQLRQHFGVPEDQGVMIGGLVDDSPAVAAGLKVGDVVTRVGDREITSIGRMLGAVRDKKKGDAVEIEYYRNGRPHTTTAVLDARQRIEYDFGRYADQWEDFGERWAEWGERFGERWAEWGERFGEDFAKRFGEDFAARFEDVELDPEDLKALQELGELGAVIGAEQAEAVAEALKRAFESPEWAEAMQRLEHLEVEDLENLNERMEELNERMEELNERIQEEVERKLEETERKLEVVDEQQ